MLEDGLGYPVRSESGLARMIIGGVLLFFSFFIVPAVAAFGYLIEVLTQTAAGSDEPPEFTDWGNLVVKGIVGIVISIAYSIVPVVFLAVIFALAGVGGAAGSGRFAAGLGVFGVLLAMIASLLVFYVLPAGLTNYAAKGDIAAAFELGTIKSTVLSVDYLLAMVLPLVVVFLLNIVAAVLAITVVGLLLLPFVSFYGYVAIFRMFGLAYRSTQGDIRTDPDRAPTAA